MLRLYRACLFLLFIVLTACGAQRVPTSVTKDEYSVYSEWLSRHDARRPRPVHLLIVNHTFPIARMQCGRLRGPEVRALEALGDAEYLLFPEHASGQLTVSFPYTAVDGVPRLPMPKESYEFVEFTRVAFNKRGNQGLFWRLT